jgi:hypothetical protein
MTAPAFFQPPLADPAEVWPAIVARLDVPALRVVFATEDDGSGATPSGLFVEGETEPPEGPDDQVWGRGAVVPIVRMYGMDARLGEPRDVAFQFRAAFNNLDEPGYSSDVSLAAAHRIAYGRLQGWTPVPAAGGAFRHVRIFAPITLATYPQPRALFDEERGLYFTSAQYRFRVYL